MQHLEIKLVEIEKRYAEDTEKLKKKNTGNKKLLEQMAGDLKLANQYLEEERMKNKLAENILKLLERQNNGLIGDLDASISYIKQAADAS